MNWNDIELVIFDIDGTLYDQRRLRVRMMAALFWEVVRSRQLLAPVIISHFRRVRETLGSNLDDDFLIRQYQLTAGLCGCSEETVRRTIAEWLERRPLEHIGRCIYPGIRDLFEALAASGRKTAVFSDYPAEAKLAALGLRCSLVVSATDSDVRRLKPHPAGLIKILQSAGVQASRAVLIGDRFDRDWEAAHRAGVTPLIRSRRAVRPGQIFQSYTDPLFQPLFETEKAA